MQAHWRPWLVILLAVHAFYVPSALGGVISRPLSIVSLLITCSLLGALALFERGIARPVLVLNSLAMLAVLLVFSITSGFAEFSPGAFFLYLAIALLYLLNLRSVQNTKAFHVAFVACNAISLAAGFALMLDVQLVDEILRTFYAAYYVELVPNMVRLQKPVLTFATHSTAGFVEYLLFFMSFRTAEVRGNNLYLALAICYLVLMVALRSTTGAIFATVAGLQLAWYLGRRHQRAVVPAALGLVTASLIGALWLDVRVAAIGESVRAAILGDNIQGLMARYSVGGLLAPNFAYLSEHPLSPVGFGFSESLYYGDSGFVVNMLRGSFPLMIAVYGGLYLFLRSNLRTGSTALWIWTVIAAFEVGFTPLQYFRFVGFVPFLIVYLNSLEEQGGLEAAPTRVTA
jgi:hypothetical protein